VGNGFIVQAFRQCAPISCGFVEHLAVPISILLPQARRRPVPFVFGEELSLDPVDLPELLRSDLSPHSFPIRVVDIFVQASKETMDESYCDCDAALPEEE
jgi:hypothetical protein